ncbi:MAG: hypothetical protein Q4A52_06735, partial [Bacillota bacterium]|nr:hypothetical protein [Bacillota bacterium]
MKKILSIGLVLLILLSVIPIGLPAYAEGPSELEQGQTAGKTSGALDGEIAGTLDATAKRKADAKAAMPDEKTITEKFNLLNDSSTYRSAFLKGYREGFVEGYLKAYRTTSIEVAKKDPGKVGGETLGKAFGTRDAMIDYQSGRSNDPAGAYKRFLAQGSLESRFSLAKESKEYVKSFKAAFEDQYKGTYELAYSERNIKHEERGSVSTEISYFEREIEYQWSLYDTATASITENLNYHLKVKFPPGSIYEPTRVIIQGIQRSFGRGNYRYIPATSSVKIELLNNSKNYNFRKPVELFFPFFGSEKVGIYRWQNSRWEYMNTIVSDDGVKTVIEPGRPLAGEYALFIDEKAAPIRDTLQHQLGKVINLFARRHFIDNHAFFRPDAPMTRLEMANLLFAMFGNQYFSGTPAISDVGYQPPSLPAVEFVVHNRFLTLDKGRFLPNNK